MKSADIRGNVIIKANKKEFSIAISHLISRFRLKVEDKDFIFIKVNVPCASGVQSAACTDPFVLEKIIIELKKINPKAQIIIVESESYGKTRDYKLKGKVIFEDDPDFDRKMRQGFDFSMKIAGIERVCKKHKISIINISRLEKGKIKLGKSINQDFCAMPTIFFNKKSLLISLAKFKTHDSLPQTHVTLSLKNQFGMIATPCKFKYHGGPKHKSLIKNIYDINIAVQQMFKDIIYITEGVRFAMEGNGPRVGDVIKDWGIIVAGRLPIEVDTIGSAMMGFEPQKIPYLKWISDQNKLGSIRNINLHKIPADFIRKFKNPVFKSKKHLDCYEKRDINKENFNINNNNAQIELLLKVNPCMLKHERQKFFNKFQKVIRKNKDTKLFWWGLEFFLPLGKSVNQLKKDCADFLRQFIECLKTHQLSVSDTQSVHMIADYNLSAGEGFVHEHKEIERKSIEGLMASNSVVLALHDKFPCFKWCLLIHPARIISRGQLADLKATRKLFKRKNDEIFIRLNKMNKGRINLIIETMPLTNKGVNKDPYRQDIIIGAKPWHMHDILIDTSHMFENYFWTHNKSARRFLCNYPASLLCIENEKNYFVGTKEAFIKRIINDGDYFHLANTGIKYDGNKSHPIIFEGCPLEKGTFDFKVFFKFMKECKKRRFTLCLEVNNQHMNSYSLLFDQLEKLFWFLNHDKNN